MKNLAILLLTGLVFFLLFSCRSGDELPEEPEQPEPCRICECADPPTAPAWDFPAKTGTAEWVRERWDYSIPEEILSSLSTADLTALCAQNPDFRYEIAFESFFILANRPLHTLFNGIQELFEREDAAEELVKHYNCLIQEVERFTCDFPAAPFLILETLMGLYAQKVEGLSEEDLQKMLHCITHGYEKIIENLTCDYFPRHYLVCTI